MLFRDTKMGEITIRKEKQGDIYSKNQNSD